jgi:hypothetical protein
MLCSFHGSLLRPFSSSAPLFIAGQTIKGYVSVDINSIEAKFPVNPLDFQVKIRVVGKELSKIVSGASARKAERTLLLQQKQLHHVTRTETCASHRWLVFSFEMEIPTQMPGSLRCDEGGLGQRLLLCC